MSEQLALKQKQAIGLTVVILFLVVFAVIGLVIWKTLMAKPTVAAILEENNTLLFNAPRALMDVELTRHDGQPFTNEQFKGHWDIVNFGYTYCPDICPTNMADMNIAYKQLTEQGLADQISVWMFSVDPQRDTPEQLSQYVPYFNPAFIGVTGDLEQLTALGSQMSAVFYKEGDGEAYTVAHSDNFAILNPDGEFVALMRPPHKPSHLITVMQTLINAQ
jgi:protein SCO1/2